MAKKRRRSKKKKRASLSLSDGVKQSILAVGLITIGAILLLAFFNLAGVVGVRADEALESLLGWDRWLFSLVILILGWSAIFPSKALLSKESLFGIGMFFIAFNGLLNLILVDTDGDLATEFANAGGYIGILVSGPLVSLLGFWGSFTVASAVLLIAIFLVFDLSLHSILTIHTHFVNLGDAMKQSDSKRKTVARVRERESDRLDDNSGGFEEGIQVEEKSLIEDKMQIEKKKDNDVKDVEFEIDNNLEMGEGQDSEAVVTTTTRRRVEVPIDLLDSKKIEAESGDTDLGQELIQHTFENFNINVEMVDVRVGPSVTQYAFRPARGVKLSRIIALQNDLALALAAHPIRIEAPIPGKSLVGIEVPNKKVGSVSLREMLEAPQFKHRKSNTSAPLGKDVGGNVDFLQVDKAPHTLVAGATGSGKSVCLNVIITSLLYQNGPDDMKFIMVDPKRVELGVYTGIPHLLVPPITKADEAVNALKWGVREMERRLDYLAKFGARDIDSYNKNSSERMPKIVFIIDELADLMSQNKREVESLIVRIAQMARAAGIHLILATQRPSVDVITGTIKANIPTRLAFSVASQVDSKTILDTSGAEKLLGKGDMLISTPSLSKPKRLQGAYVSDQEIERIVEFLKKHGEPDYNYQITEDSRAGGVVLDSESGGKGGADPLFDQAVQIILESKKASTSYLQRRMSIGYSRAARMIDLLEEQGVIGPQNGSKPRIVLVDTWPPVVEDNTDDQADVEEVDEYEEVDEVDDVPYDDEA